MVDRIASRAVIACALACALACAMPASAVAATGLERASRAVVAVAVGPQIVGSGVVIAPGYALTAAHVVDDVAGFAPVLVVGGAETTFTVVAIDRARDLALLSAPTFDVQPVVVADSGALTRGQDVTAIGFPVGLRSVTFTRGVVSSPAQEFRGRTFVQTDAAINPGNSGGPLVDSEGRLVAINVEKLSGGGVDTVGFSVPGADALAFVREAAPGAAVELTPGTGQRITWFALAFAALGLMSLSIAYFVIERRVRLRRAELSGVVEASQAASRRTFHIDGPGTHEERSLRLPAVVGAASNADIRVTDPGVREYEARIGLEAFGTVAVTSLTGSDGVYCGDACVNHAVIEPGMSFRVGRTTITLLQRRGAGPGAPADESTTEGTPR